MNKFIVILFLMTSFVFATDFIDGKDLREVGKDSISIGTGENIEYIFIDPDCKYSQRFLTKIVNNKEALAYTTYKFVLAKLDKFNSNAKINYIRSAKDPKEALISFMVKKEYPSDFNCFASRTSIESAKINTFCDTNKIKSRPFAMLADDF